jgi:histidinol phosphatase-like PHP family hydrolase
MSKPVCNLHNHTPFSDGAYTIDEICAAHLELKNIRVAGVGISDHLFCTPSSREITNEREFERAFAGELRAYVEEVRAARQRWAGKLQLFCGAELNWPLNRTMLNVIREMLTGSGIDYVLVEYTDWAGLTQLANQARRFPCPVGLAHTAVGEQYPNTSMDQVIRTLANARIFYEISSKFLPLDEHDRWFSLLPQHRVAVTIGTDTHDDLRCLQDLSALQSFVERRGLSEKLLSPGPREVAALTA